MPKLDNTEWEAASESSAGDFKAMEPGIYMCEIKGIQTEWDTKAGHATSDERQCVRVLLDVAEGEFAGELSRPFFADKDYARVIYMSWKPTAMGMLKHTFRGIDEANPGFDSKAAFEADKWTMFVGKKCLVQFNGVEYTNDRGYTNVSARPDRILTADDKPTIKVKLENDSIVNWDDYKAVDDPAPRESTAASAYDDSDIPF